MLISEVEILIKLVLVMPATNATSDRTFSTLRRVKSYLRSTMTPKRLNHLMVLPIHKDMTDALTDARLDEAANLLVGDSKRRKSVFGKFTIQALANCDRPVRNKSTQTITG